jgi:hypothetical protein
MTLMGDVLPEFNPLLTGEVIAVLRDKYRDALAAQRSNGLFAVCDAMGLFDGLADKDQAKQVLDGVLPAKVADVLLDQLAKALEEDPQSGVALVYLDEPGEWTAKRAMWPAAPRTVVVTGPHP